MQTKKRKPWIKWTLISGVVLLAVAAAIVWYLFNLKFDDTKNIKADYTVNAIDFLNQFKSGDSTVNKKYRDKTITVNGRVSETEAAIDSSINIKMTDTLTGNYIIFSFQNQHLNETKKIKAGDSVSIKGSFSEGIYSEVFESVMVNFKRCTLNK
jgi:tRNA_anti-like